MNKFFIPPRVYVLSLSLGIKRLKFFPFKVLSHTLWFLGGIFKIQSYFKSIIKLKYNIVQMIHKLKYTIKLC